MKTCKTLKEISPRLPDTEHGHALSVLNSLGQWEPDLGIVELLDLRPPAIASFYDFHLDNLYGVSSRTMTRTHVSVALSHRAADRQVTVLTVHIVRTRTGVVSQPDSKVLYFDG